MDDDIPSVEAAQAAFDATRPMTQERLDAALVLDAAWRKHRAILRAEKMPRTICEGCGKRLRAKEPLVARRFHRRGPYWRFYCRRCDRRMHAEDFRGRRGYPYAEHFARLEQHACATCSRPMYFNSFVGSRRVPCCSYQCEYRLKIRKQLESRRVHHEPIACKVCGETFTPKRADAVTCGNTCRQRLFRQRKRM